MTPLVSWAPASAKCCDTSVKLLPAMIADLARAGYRAIGRYVPLPGNRASSDVDEAEAQAILGAGLSYWLVQHVREPPWRPSEHHGMADGLSAANAARAAGYPSTAHIFLDLEGVSGGAPDAKKFAEDWAASVRASGFSAGLYVGYGVPLDADALYLLHGFDAYWADPGPRNVSTRGICLKQWPSTVAAGLQVDEDSVMLDELGMTFRWASPGGDDVDTSPGVKRSPAA